MMSATDSRFTLSYSHVKQSGKYGFIFGGSNKVGYGQPRLCDDGGCKDYPSELKSKYPETYMAYTVCEAAGENGTKII